MESALPVTLVVDPEFGNRIIPLVENSDVWIVQSQQNSESSGKVWAKTGGQSHQHQGSLTTFEPQGTTKEDWAFSAIDLIDQHHGEYAQTNPYNSLVVIGSEPTSLIVDTLAELGFGDIEETKDGFIANRSVGAA